MLSRFRTSARLQVLLGVLSWPLRCLRTHYVQYGQVGHLTLVVVIALEYAVLKASLPVDDKTRTKLDGLVAAVGLGWAALAFVELVRKGPRKDVGERIRHAYSIVLGSAWWLTAANVLLCGVVVFCSYELLMFRQVEFYSAASADLYLDEPGKKIKRISGIEAGKPVILRLPVGRRWLVVFEDRVEGDIPVRRPVYTLSLDVLPPWKEEPVIWHNQPLHRVELPEASQYDSTN